MATKTKKSAQVMPTGERAKFLRDMKKVNQRMMADRAAAKKQKKEEEMRQIRAMIQDVLTVDGIRVPFQTPISPIKSPRPRTSTPKKGSVTLYRACNLSKCKQ